MATPSSQRRHRQPVFGGFDRSVEHLLGADLRILYGMAAPILIVVGLIVVLALQPAAWVVAVVVAVEVCALAVVLTGVFGMLDEDDTDE